MHSPSPLKLVHSAPEKQKKVQKKVRESVRRILCAINLIFGFRQLEMGEESRTLRLMNRRRIAHLANHHEYGQLEVIKGGGDPEESIEVLLEKFRIKCHIRSYHILRLLRGKKEEGNVRYKLFERLNK